MKMSKYLYFIILIAMLPSICLGQNVSFYSYKDWNSLLTQAQRSKKKVFINFGAPWCTPCRSIIKNIFPDSSVSRLLNQSSVNIEVNIDDSSFVELVKKYRVISVPVIVILNENGFMIKREMAPPSENASLFYSWLKGALSSDSIVRGVSNSLNLNYPNFYNAYFVNKPKIEPNTNIVNEFLAKQKSIGSEVYWDVLSSFAHSPDQLQVLIDNYGMFKNLYGKEVDAKIGENYTRSLKFVVKNKDSAGFRKLLEVVSKMWKPEQRDCGIYYQSIQFFGKTGLDWNKFQQLVKEYNQKYGIKNNFDFCEVMYQSCFEKELCLYMASLMEPIAKAEANSKNYIIYATLLLKGGQKATAEEYFSGAVKLAQTSERKMNWQKEIDEIKSSL